MKKISFAVLMMLLAGCISAQQATTTPATQELAKFKAKLMSADYRADIDELSRLKDEVAKLATDRDLGYLAQYWSGFASWRIAMNGANRQMKTEDQKMHLLKAATAFYSSIRLKEDFADSYAAADLVDGWLATVSMGANPDMVAVRERVYLSQALFTRANALDPQNPRVLWAKAAFLQFAPPPYQNIGRAIEVYKQMLDESERRGVDPASPFPDWGKPEALMSLAYAHSK